MRHSLLGEPDYPGALAATDDAPLISLKGDAALLARSVVGARNASANGRRLARDLALQLGRRGSSSSLGWRAASKPQRIRAHSPPETVAVIAGGIDVVYPEESRDLSGRSSPSGRACCRDAGRHRAAGALPSALKPPVSGPALGVLVVEAALRSGSLITARNTLEQGREVFAVPGSPLDPRCRGTNDLIRRGPHPTASADDVLAELEGHLAPPLVRAQRAAFAPAPAPPGPAELSRAIARGIERLSAPPVPVDEIIRQCGLPRW